MSTRSIIGIKDSEKSWHGVYHHWDGYPEGVGVTLLSLAKDKGIDFIKEEVVNKHPEGWSTINRNWDINPVNCRKVDTYKIKDNDKKPPEHYDPAEEGRKFITQKKAPGSYGSEYLYLIADNSIEVYQCEYVKGKYKGDRMVGAFGMGAPDIGRGKDVKWVLKKVVKVEDNIEVMKHALEEDKVKK